MAVNKEAIKKSASSGGYKSNAEGIVYRQGERAREGCAVVMAYLFFNAVGAGLFGLGYIGDEPSLELVGGAILGMANVNIIIDCVDYLIAKFQPKDINDNSSQ